MPELTVIIPTRDRCPVLCETLAGLERQSGSARFEVKVVDDGSCADTREAVGEFAARGAIDIELMEQSGCGPAAARNRALSVARAPVCVFLNDDTWPREDLLARHRDFHASNPEPEAALLGAMVLPPNRAATPFMHWALEQSFDYAGIEDCQSAGGGRFFTANVSAKTCLLRDVGGFDETFLAAAFEDLDLGLRLEQRGMRLAYDPRAIVEHFHPTDLTSMTERLRNAGTWFASFRARHREWPEPRRPGFRHRVKAAALTFLAPVSRPRLKREIWRFLCHEALREGYWNTIEGRRDAHGESANTLRIGNRLAGIARRDEDATMPASPSAIRGRTAAGRREHPTSASFSN
ncbi:MAG: glycosyltransferase family 2 protein [Thermoleophilaceae bacterium]